MAAARSLFISEPLCFLSNKFGKLPLKSLKSILIDFYSSEVVSDAKDALINCVDDLKLDKYPRPPRRRNPSKETQDAKLRVDIDDILSLYTFLDENLLLSRLPIFVAANTDLIPSMKMVEGDMCAILRKLESLDHGIESVRHSLEVAACRPPVKLQQQPILIKDSVGMASGDMSEGCESAGQTADDEGNPWQNPMTRKKRRKVGASPQLPQTSHSSVVVNNSATPRAMRTSQLGARKTVIGASTSCSLKASKSLWIKKLVYKLGNIDSSYCSDDICQYVKSIGVRILTCFELPPPKRQLSEPAPNKSFRICIVAEDKLKLLSQDNWSVGISLREWVFHPKNATNSATTGVVLSHEMGSVSDTAEGIAEYMSDNAPTVTSNAGLSNSVLCNAGINKT
jgi:hypothetical protein